MSRKNRITKEQIIETARRLFRKQGYAWTTLDQVAAELGVTRAAIYHWVPSKESVLCEIHERVMDLITARFVEISAQDIDEIAKLSAVLQSHVLAVAGNLDALTVFFQDEAALPAAPARQIALRKRNYDQAVEKIVRAGQQKGTIRRDLDAKIVVKSLMAMGNWAYQWYNPEGPASPEELARHVVQIALAGICEKKESV